MFPQGARCIRPVMLILAAVVIASGLHTWAVELQPAHSVTERRPLWEVDLKQFGYLAFQRKQMRPLRPSAEFTDTEHVAVGWVSPDTNQSNKQTYPRWGGAAHLHVVLLDAKSGRKEYDTEWPTSYTATAPFYGLADGRLVICADNSLQLLSPTFDVLRQEQLPNKAACSKFILKSSPSRQTLLLSSVSEHIRQLQLLHTDTFQRIRSWTETLGDASNGETVSISDSLMAGYCGRPRQLCLREFDGTWHPFEPGGVNTRMADRERIPTSFVENKILVIGTNPAVVANVDGARLFNIELPKRHYLLLPISATGGNRFAVIEGRLRGVRSEPLDMYPFQANDRALVYSIKTGKQEFSLKIQGTSPWTPWHIREAFLALSPDGVHLAVISEGVLRAYHLQ